MRQYNQTPRESKTDNMSKLRRKIEFLERECKELEDN